MVKRVRPVLYVVAAVIAVAGIVLGAQWLARQNDDQIVEGPDVSGESETDSSDVARAQHPPLSEALGVGESDFVEVGGVNRPKRDVAFAESAAEPVVSEKSVLRHPGKVPAVAKDANPDVAALHAELAKEKPSPAAISNLFVPEPFDARAYATDRESWLKEIRPGRVFQSAQPGPEVVPIKSSSNAFQNVVQGEKVILEVQAEPGAPVTFYTPQVGEFSNRLTTQSVAAAEDGIARATYTATSGTQGLVDILAASPIHSGQLRYRVRVSLPAQN